MKKKVLRNSIQAGSLSSSELREAGLQGIKAAQVELKDKDSYNQLKRQYGFIPRSKGTDSLAKEE